MNINIVILLKVKVVRDKNTVLLVTIKQSVSLQHMTCIDFNKLSNCII